MGLKQKCFEMRRRKTGLKHLCDKNYNVAEDKMDSGGSGSDGGGSGQWSTGGGRRSAEGMDNGCGCLMAGEGDAAAVDVFLMLWFSDHSHVHLLALIVALNCTLTPDHLWFLFSYVSRKISLCNALRP